MKLFDKLFNRPFRFNKGVSTMVQVFDSSKSKHFDEILSGFISEVDFNNRVVIIDHHVVSIDNIVTISRMRDGRLRMWIKR